MPIFLMEDKRVRGEDRRRVRESRKGGGISDADGANDRIYFIAFLPSSSLSSLLVTLLLIIIYHVKFSFYISLDLHLD